MDVQTLKLKKGHCINRKHGRAALEYAHPDLEPILKPTHVNFSKWSSHAPCHIGRRLRQCA